MGCIVSSFSNLTLDHLDAARKERTGSDIRWYLQNRKRGIAAICLRLDPFDCFNNVLWSNFLDCGHELENVDKSQPDPFWFIVARASINAMTPSIAGGPHPPFFGECGGLRKGSTQTLNCPTSATEADMGHHPKCAPPREGTTPG
jgi:hypothetical protein